MIFMDEMTMESLDFQYILNGINPITPLGKLFKGRLKAYIPGEEEELEAEYDKIQSLIKYMEDNSVRREFNNLFSQVKDIRNSIRRAYEGMILSQVELFEIKILLFTIREISDYIKEKELPVYDETEIIPVERLEKLLDPEETKISTFYIYDEYSEELKRIRDRKQEIDREIKLNIREIRDKITRDFDLKVAPDSSVTLSKTDKETLEKIEDYPYLTYISETYMNVKFKVRYTEDMEELDRQLTILMDREEREEQRVREELSKEIGKRRKSLFKNIANIGRLDLLLAKTRYAVDIEGIKPNIVKENIIEIVEGVHPKVRDFLKTKDLQFTPISISIEKGATCITGANMGGKSVSLKLTGLLTAMAQYGLFVPAEEMNLGLRYYIESSIGDMQSTDSGLSTFGGEIEIVSKALSKSDKKGLILIDELARGTNPQEGHAISRAIVEYLKDKEPITLLTTHYDHIATLEGVKHLQVVGLSNIDLEDIFKEVDVDAKMDFINKHMDYRLKTMKMEESVPRDALNIASIMGLEKEIIDMAEDYLDENKEASK